MGQEQREQLVAADVTPFSWDSGRTVRYEVAVEGLNRAIGTATSALREARLQEDPDAAAVASARVANLVHRQEHLHPDDGDAVEAAIAEGYEREPRRAS